MITTITRLLNVAGEAARPLRGQDVGGHGTAVRQIRARSTERTAGSAK